MVKFEPKDTEMFSQDIITYVQEKTGLKDECDYEESIEYFTYEDSDWSKNNKVGLYIYAENESYFEIAQQLVNSSGGDWGYVTIPFNVKDKDFEKWERVFRQLRNKHLIPIVQLWDVDIDKYEEQTREAAEFLNRFVWPVKERYVSAYNEMNSANFWYGEINPEEYARILDYTIYSFNEVNSDFFMLNGALNISAPNNNDHMDAFVFMSKMNHEVPGIFEKLDGWASHPYPQPNFSGNPHASGRWSVKAYENELNFLKYSIGVEKELPVFITETGWAHAQGKDYNGSFVDAELAAEYIRIAYEEIWLLDDRVRAVTPFTIRYKAPFDHFSWINQDGVPYVQYDKVKSIDKIAGNPPHFEVNLQKVSGCENE
ncbi:hypothetical protein ACFLZK_01250 [Patescibacteria group bacterium]